ncbi:hypothetical protein O181_004619 [Austropuccinia psidii MF-1]|uniref:Uncharacterized protein n=1 Tax=Austropuccinia psidii MF-1 TaxID=1389203 RepID=A0A9Q3GF24_9BASI|nr:hypothetical protein [Austropuccinia psidii MF-1]
MRGARKGRPALLLHVTAANGLRDKVVPARRTRPTDIPITKGHPSNNITGRDTSPDRLELSTSRCHDVTVERASQLRHGDMKEIRFQKFSILNYALEKHR